MQARQQILRDVVVPERLDLFLVVALCLPPLDHRLVDEVNHLDEERAGAGGRVEDLDERLPGRSALRNLQFLVALRHLAPSGGVGQAVGEAELSAEEFVHGAHDVRDHGTRGVKDASAHLLLLVVGGEEVLVEVNDRVFMGVPVAKVAGPRPPG